MTVCMHVQFVCFTLWPTITSHAYHSTLDIIYPNHRNMLPCMNNMGWASPHGHPWPVASSLASIAITRFQKALDWHWTSTRYVSGEGWAYIYPLCTCMCGGLVLRKRAGPCVIPMHMNCSLCVMHVGTPCAHRVYVKRSLSPNDTKWTCFTICCPTQGTWNAPFRSWPLHGVPKTPTCRLSSWVPRKRNKFWKTSRRWKCCLG